MKKFTIVFLLTAIVAMAQAQQRTAIKMDNLVGNFQATKGDTLIPPSFMTGTPTFYTTMAGGTDTGYVAGPNGYGDKAKAQQFISDIPCTILGCMVWIAEKFGTTGTVDFKVYNSNGNGTAASGAVTTAPGTVLGSVTQNFSDMVAGTDLATGANIYMLTTPVAVSAPYYVGLDFSALGPFPANKFAIVSTTDGDGGGMDLPWEQWSDNAWYSMLNAWPLDFDFGFFPIVELGAGIQDAFVHNLIVNVFPNPVSDIANVEYTLRSNAKKVDFRVFDANGKVVITMEMGSQNAGTHTLSFDASNLAAGTYYYGIVADRNNLIKPLVIQ